MNWRDFFKRNADYALKGIYFETSNHFSVEELYQAFKERMEHENMLKSHHELCNLRHNDGLCNCVDYG